MSWRGTFLLLLLAALAAGYFFFSERSRTHPPQEPLLGFDPSQASEIQVQEGSSLISLLKKNGLWMIRSGQSGSLDRINPELINSLLETAAEITPLDILRSGDLKGNVTLASLGLKKPNRSLSIRADKNQTLLIGAEGAAPETLYARLDSGKTVYLISSKIAAIAFRPVQEYRDPRLTILPSDHLDEITLTKRTELQQLRLKRDQKGERSWLLETPVSAKGDDEAVNAWLKPLLGAQIIRWIPEEGDSTSSGLDTPSAVITLHEEGASHPVTLTLGAPSPDTPGGIYVKCSDRPGFAVVTGLTNILATTPQSLRSKKIKQVEYDTVDRIEASETSFERKKGSDDWIARQKESTNTPLIPADQMKQWYDQLQGLSASSFEAATPEHLIGRNLTATNHALTIRLIARLSENTAQEDKGESVLAEYAFGSSSNNEVALREGDAPELLILPESSLEFLKTFPTQLPRQ
jgi:hypothetical protein